MASEKDVTKRKLNTLADLLAAVPGLLQRRGGRTANQINCELGKQKTVVHHLAKFLDNSVQQTPIQAIVDTKGGFLQYLKGLPLSEDVIARYQNSRRRLLSYGRELGWSPETFALENEWRFVAEGGVQRLSGVVNHALENKIPTAEFSEEHVNSWKQEMKQNGLAPSTIGNNEYYFRAFIKKNAFESRFPLLDFTRKQPISFRLSRQEMDTALAAEFLDIEEWIGRGTLHICAEWQQSIIRYFEQLCGYAVRYRKMRSLTSLDIMLKKKFIRDYAHWLSSTCGWKQKAIYTMLSGISTVLRWHPRFDKGNFGWIMGIAAEIPKEPESQRKARNDARKVDYWKLAKIPAKIRHKRLAMRGGSPNEIAWLMHDEALMTSLVIAVWPPEFIVFAKIHGPEPNLFRTPIDPAGPPMAIDEWAIQATKKDPQVPLWQFSFGLDGQRSSHARGLVLSHVFPVLEEYLENHRPLLVRGNDSGSLFFDRRGGPIDHCALRNAVKRLTEQIVGKAISPSSIQKSFCDFFLDSRPGDYENLSSILWLKYSSVRAYFDPDFRRSWRYFKAPPES